MLLQQKLSRMGGFIDAPSLGVANKRRYQRCLDTLHIAWVLLVARNIQQIGPKSSISSMQSSNREIEFLS